MEKAFKDYFMILEIHYTASQSIVKSSYKQLCKTHHPDLGGDIKIFREIQEAYEVLSNPMQREKYEFEWLGHHRKFSNQFDTGVSVSLYDLAYFSARQTVLEYMFFILNHDFESAYALLSDYNHKKIHKKDYKLWQSLIGEIHQLIEFDCAIETINPPQSLEIDLTLNEKTLVFKVKVKERNLILNRIEEEIFFRKVVSEKGAWKIRLNDIDVKKIIKKYGKIIVLSHKNKKKLNAMRPHIEDHYPTQELAFDVFVKHCEYEFSRFLRYKSPFVVIKIDIDSEPNSLNVKKQVCDVLKHNTRSMDAYTQYGPSRFLIFLPETEFSNGQFVAQKLCGLLISNVGFPKKITIENTVLVCDGKYVSFNEMLDLLI